MGQKRTIAVVTGSRAEFGLLESVMREIDAQPSLSLQAVVAGLHLTTNTWRDVAAAGFEIRYRVAMQRRSKRQRKDDDHVGRHADVQAVARGIAGFGKAFESIQPDAVVVLGDRVEAFAAASAASVGGIRVAHIHGGDRAEGVADEAMRHAISKLAHLHFTATATSRKRLIRMGESPDNVLNVGSPAMDALQSMGPPRPHVGFVVMLHPIGETDKEAARHMRNVITAVRHSAQELDAKDAAGQLSHFFFNPNADPGSNGIMHTLDQLVPRDRTGKRKSPSFKRVKHMPRADFLQLLSGAKAIVGNSSAGLIEAAALKVPCVNIGPRQNGREKPGHVVDCNYAVDAIKDAIQRAPQLNLKPMRHPYGNGRTGEAIAKRLATIDLQKVDIRKQNTY